MRSALEKVPGVQKADVDWKKGEAVVVLEKGKVQVAQLQEAIAKAGYRASMLPISPR